MNWEEPFEVRHYLSKTMQLFTESTGSASEWFLSTMYLSLVGLFPAVGHTKKAVIPTPGLFIERKYAVSFNNLCRKYRQSDLLCINKKTWIPTLFQRRQPAILFQADRNTSHTHIQTQTHKRKQWKVSFNLFTLTIPPALEPEALDFSRRLPQGRMVADKTEQAF